jgi:hypothetical protein
VDALLAVLAVLGALALLARLAVALLFLGVRAVESTAAAGLAEVSERRGDVTGFLERRDSASVLRRARRRAALGALAWALLLAVPPMAGVAREVYAAAALLWLLPRPQVTLPVRRGG